MVFVLLNGTPAQLNRRVAARTGHSMPASLLESLIATLEPFAAEENKLVVDIGSGPGDEAGQILAALKLIPEAATMEGREDLRASR